MIVSIKDLFQQRKRRREEQGRIAEANQEALAKLQRQLNAARVNKLRETEERDEKEFCGLEKMMRKGHIPSGATMDRYYEILERRTAIAKSILLPKLRPARLHDYLLWLKGYIDGGGQITHVYNYPFDQFSFLGKGEWFVARADIKPARLCGANAVSIIVPSGINAEHGDWGHCNLYFMDGYRHNGFVPLYCDVNFQVGLASSTEN